MTSAPLFDGFHPAQVNANRAVELQGPSARGDLRAAVGDSDFFPDLVDEDYRGSGAVDAAGQFALCLGHKPGL